MHVTALTLFGSFIIIIVIIIIMIYSLFTEGYMYSHMNQ